MRARASIHIEREPEVVFARLADFATHSSWRHEVLSTQVMGKVGRGTHIVQQVSAQGRGAVLDLEVTEYVPPERISFRARGAPRARGSFRLEPKGDGTMVHASATVELEGSASLAEDRIREVAEDRARHSLARLKSQLEGEGG